MTLLFQSKVLSTQFRRNECILKALYWNFRVRARIISKVTWLVIKMTWPILYHWKNVFIIRKSFPISGHLTSTVTFRIFKQVHPLLQTPTRECRLTKKSNQTYGLMESREIWRHSFNAPQFPNVRVVKLFEKQCQLASTKFSQVTFKTNQVTFKRNQVTFKTN